MACVATVPAASVHRDSDAAEPSGTQLVVCFMESSDSLRHTGRIFSLVEFFQTGFKAMQGIYITAGVKAPEGLSSTVRASSRERAEKAEKPSLSPRKSPCPAPPLLARSLRHVLGSRKSREAAPSPPSPGTHQSHFGEAAMSSAKDAGTFIHTQAARHAATCCKTCAKGLGVRLHIALVARPALQGAPPHPAWCQTEHVRSCRSWKRGRPLAWRAPLQRE